MNALICGSCFLAFLSQIVVFLVVSRPVLFNPVLVNALILYSLKTPNN